jgi:hypothetical protein
LLPVCRHSEASPVLAVFIFLSFTLLCAFVLMSIMIAVVTTGIRERIEEIQGSSRPDGTPLLRRCSTRQSLRYDSKKKKKGQTLSREWSKDFSTYEVHRSLMISFDPETILLMLTRVWKNAETESGQRQAETLPSATAASSIDSWTIFSTGNNFKEQSIAFRNLIHHPVYTLTFTFVIILAALLQLIVLQESKPSSSGSGWEWIEWLQYLIQAYFMVDIFMRVKAHYPDYLSFLWEDSWNTFDLILVILTLLPIFATGTSAERSLGTSAVRSRCSLVLTTVSQVSSVSVAFSAS